MIYQTTKLVCWFLDRKPMEQLILSVGAIAVVGISTTGVQNAMQPTAEQIATQQYIQKIKCRDDNQDQITRYAARRGGDRSFTNTADIEIFEKECANVDY